jgi:alkylhydroperoxidase family enzyme
VPRYFLFMASDPKYAKIVLDREIATVHQGEVSRLNKELVAYATSVVNDGKLSMLYRAEVLRGLGLTNEQLFEVTTVVSIFVRAASFATALQLEASSG